MLPNSVTGCLITPAHSLHALAPGISSVSVIPKNTYFTQVTSSQAFGGNVVLHGAPVPSFASVLNRCDTRRVDIRRGAGEGARNCAHFQCDSLLILPLIPRAHSQAQSQGRVYIPCHNDLDVCAGQSTVAHDLILQNPYLVIEIEQCKSSQTSLACPVAGSDCVPGRWRHAARLARDGRQNSQPAHQSASAAGS